MDRELIYDIGAHNGDDIAYYRHLGYRVVAVEANPELAQMVCERFPVDVANGSVIVENVAIAEREGTTPFFICEHGSIYSSIDREAASSHGKTVREISVSATTLPALFGRHGVPYFVKVDIEGADHLCVRSLSSSSGLPAFFSFEVGDDASDLVCHFVSLGYDRFRLVSQQDWCAVTIPPPGTLIHISWSARQMARLMLRRLPCLHRIITYTAKAAMYRGLYRRPKVAELPSSDKLVLKRGHSGPPPWSTQHGWCDIPSFFYVLHCAKASGLIGSSWYDIHACMSQASENLRGD